MVRVDLAGIHSKLERARVHYRQFRDEADDLVRAYADAVRQTSRSDGVHTYVLRGAPPVPDHWSALVGDIAHNLRSALDHLAWQMVVASGGAPRRQRPATTFPILTDEPPGGVMVHGGLRPDLLDLVVQEQPFKRFPERPQVSPLALVQGINNLDKHVRVVPVVGVLRFAAWSAPDGVNVRLDLASRMPVEGREIGTLVTEPNYDGDLGASFEFEVRAHPDTDVPGLGTGDLCHWALGVAAESYFPRVVDRFEEMLVRLRDGE